MPDCLLGITREGPTQANGRAVDTGFPKLNPNELSQTGRARVPLVPFPFSQRLRPYRNVWSAALSQAKNDGDRLVCANVYGLCWSTRLLALMECAALSSYLARQSWKTSSGY